MTRKDGLLLYPFSELESFEDEIQKAIGSLELVKDEVLAATETSSDEERRLIEMGMSMVIENIRSSSEEIMKILDEALR